MHTDHRYIQALLDGDSALIRDIYAHHAATVKVWVERNGGSGADAKDVMQDAIIAITRQARRPGWQLNCPFGAYLFMVCKGKWLNELKRRRRAGVTKGGPDGLEVGEDAESFSERTLVEKRKCRLFYEKFGQLGKSCQLLLRLAWSGRPMEEVAATLGVTYAYVRKKKSKCIASLIDSIQKDPEYQSLKAKQP